MTNKSKKMIVPNSRQSLEKMKYEIASELGVTIGPNASSRSNGKVGGEITKRLVHMAKNQICSVNHKSK